MGRILLGDRTGGDMKVYVFPADETGCGYYRMIWPSRALIAQGYDVTIIPPGKRNSGLRGATDAHGNLIDVQVPDDADVVVLQRITHRHLVSAVQIMRQRGVSVVIDMDDDLSSIHPANPAFNAMHPVHGSQKDHNWVNAQLACEQASMVILSTDALMKRYASHGRGMVVRNCIPKRYLDIPRVDSTLIGWGGSVRSHPNDLQVVGAGVSQVIDDGNTFRVVGPDDYVKRLLNLSQDPEATGPRDILHEWPAAVAELGIGIAPLADTQFNAAKSYLKPLEYSALGVPWVASPRAEYSRLHKLGAGLLANKPRQWASSLRKLVSDDALRKDMSAAGREVAASMTIEGNAWRWMEVWDAAYQVDH